MESPPLPAFEPPAAPAPGRVDPPTLVHPISAERYMFQFPVPRVDHDRFRHLQGLLSHSVPSGDVTLIFGRMLVISIDHCEKRKFGATTRPLLQARPAEGKRTIPAHIRREVWLRDEGQCTFVAANGHRCATRRFLEFDHVEPVGRGGEATAPDRVRLRCRAHNQLEAERVFGLAFMQAKRATTTM
jgi:5-methylcytosine-specific restriction endonuclease McrA